MPSDDRYRFDPDAANSANPANSADDAGDCGTCGPDLESDAPKQAMPAWGVAGAAGAAIGVAMIILGVLHDTGAFVVLNDSPLFMGVGLSVIGGVLAATANASRGGTVTERKSSYG